MSLFSMGADQGLIGLPPQQGHVAVAHQDAAGKARQGLPGALDGVAGAPLGLLHGVEIVVVGGA